MGRSARGRRRGARVAGTGCATLLIVAAIAAAILLRDPRPHIERRRSSLVAVTAQSAPPPASVAGAAAGLPRPAPSADSVAPAHVVDLVELRAASGLRVEVAVKRPAATTDGCAGGAPGAARATEATRDGTPSASRAGVLLLGGHRTGRNAVHLVDDTRGTVVAAMSYPFAGNPRVKGPAILGEVPGIRTAIRDTPAAIMLALDHLIAQPCVDPRRIELVGVSLGAPFVVIAGAVDSRVSRVWAVHGAGGIYEPLEFNLRRQVGSRAASVPLASLAWLLLAGEQLAPERWIGDVAPRPVVMINALADERIPRASVDRLYAAAREPKEMIWLPGAHVRSEAEAVRPLIDLVLSRITP